MAYDVHIDFNVVSNRNPLFRPLQRTLRGTASVDQMHDKNVNGAIAMLGEIPGQRIELDMKAKKARLVDRMALPENEHKDRQLRDLTRTEDYMRFRYERYLPTEEFDLNDEDWLRWLYHLRGIVDWNRAEVSKGQLPAMATILKQIKEAGVVVETNNALTAQLAPGQKHPHLLDVDSALAHLEPAGASN